MLIVGYCFGIRSERRLCEEVHLNLAYRWFCGLGLDGEVPDHSTFSKNRNGRFRDSDLLRRLFETVLQRCIDEDLVGGEGFAVDASLIQADASDRTRVEGAAGPLLVRPPSPQLSVSPEVSLAGRAHSGTGCCRIAFVAATLAATGRCDAWHHTDHHPDSDPARLVADLAV